MVGLLPWRPIGWLLLRLLLGWQLLLPLIDPAADSALDLLECLAFYRFLFLIFFLLLPSLLLSSRSGLSLVRLLLQFPFFVCRQLLGDQLFYTLD